MATLFRRAWSLTVASSDISQLDFEFKVKKTLKAEPNTCDLKIFNLNPDHRRSLEQSPPGAKGAAPIPVRLEAGYVGATSLLYLGDLRTAQSSIEGPDIVTEISSGDGEKAQASSRINVPMGAKASPDVALRAIANVLAGAGVGLGNVSLVASTLARKGLAIIGKGTVLSGNAAQLMTDFCNSADLEWSIQDGKIQILDRGAALAGQAIQLSASTGLVGSPAIDSKGVVTCETLIIPGLVCGYKVAFNSRNLSGGFRITQIEYTGDTHGRDWYAKITCDKY